MSESRNILRESEDKTDAAVNVAAVERCPGVNGPAAVHGPVRPEQCAPSRLPNVNKVFRIDKKPNVPRYPALSHHAEDYVGFRYRTKRIKFEALPSGVVTLDADAARTFFFPDAYEFEAMARGRSDIEPLASSLVRFARPDIGIRGRRCERRIPQSAEKFHAEIVGWLLQVQDSVLFAAVHEDGIPDARCKECRRNGSRTGTAGGRRRRCVPVRPEAARAFVSV